MAIYQKSPYATPSASNIFCAHNWGANTVYRELLVTTTSSASTSSVPTTVPTTSSPTPTSTSETSTYITRTERVPASTATSSSENRAWIAGPVIGAVAGVGIIVAAAICFLHYTRKKIVQTQQTQTALPYYSGNQWESSKQPQEMYQENPPSTSRPPVYELN